MKKLIESITGGYSSSASVVDGSLIISLPDAVSPVVWRMELEPAKSSALEIKEKDGLFVLTFKTQQGDEKDVAPFKNKATAVKALMTISTALQHAPVYAHNAAAANANNAAPPQAVPAAPAESKGSKALTTFGGLAVLVLLVYIFMQMTPKQPYIPSDNNGANNAASSAPMASGVDARKATGVPVSADDFLMKK